MSGPLVAEATDTPVWFLSGATLALAAVTAGLVWAAFRALGELQLAVQQLEEVRKDRAVQVFADLAQRWQSTEMTEALRLEQEYMRAALCELFTKRQEAPLWRPWLRRRRTLEARDRVLLLRVPNYFEDALMIAKVGAVDRPSFDEYMSGVILIEWERWEPAIMQLREDVDDLAYVEFSRGSLDR